MNYKPLLVILIFGLFYTNAQQKSEISFKEVKHKYGCRNCYGSLVVKKGNFSDTIYGGQWGNSVNYKLIKIKDKEYCYGVTQEEMKKSSLLREVRKKIKSATKDIRCYYSIYSIESEENQKYIKAYTDICQARNEKIDTPVT